MNSLLLHREPKYFMERENHQFLFSTLYPMMRCSKLKYEAGYWFNHKSMMLKATSTACVSLNDLSEKRFSYKNHPEVKGKLMWGLNNTCYLYVFWDQVPFEDAHGEKLGMPYAFEDAYYLEVL